ncbi:MAG: threonylcarbamoyl-AMP synthase [Clostridia bacterium]|nr:threonylcarbamoyl-AMP synthase [Clostridia bacterium]
MKTEIVRIDPDRVEDFSDELERAAEIIRGGGLVAFPTETVYGLGGNALDPDASRKIYEAKGRPSDNPLIAHVASVEDFEALCEIEDRERFGLIAEHFIPGPITVIQKKKPHIPDTVTAGHPTLAVRFPVHTVARALIRASGVPIAAPSANLSGRPSPTRAEHVIEDLDGRVDMIIDSGESSIGVESTIIHIADEIPKLLRPGAVTLEMLRSVLGRVEVDPCILGKMSDDVKPLAPGMKYRHYAPKSPVIAVRGEEERILSYLAEKSCEPRSAILCFDEDKALLKSSDRVLTLGSRLDKSAHARYLFDRLRAFDKMDIDKIYTRVPDDSELGLAVVNRLLKACGYTVVDVK